MGRNILKIILACLLILSFNYGGIQPASANGLPVLVGIYPTEVLSTNVGQISAIDAWLGKPTVTLAGTFLNLDYTSTQIVGELDAAWNAGYIPFVNLQTTATAAQLASGTYDAQIINWANVYRSWSNSGQKRALIAPLQEMNGYWVNYGYDPTNFKLAYYRIFQIFQQQGVQRDWVAWVFAPNGWSAQGQEFENYYPGQSVVDAVGFSSFNFGGCKIGTGEYWDTYNDAYKPYLDRMSVMAPGKPIFITEIGTVAEGAPAGTSKDAWLADTLTNLAAYPGVRGWVYFNRTEVADTLDCVPNTDYRIYQDHYGMNYSGFKNTVTQSPYGHWGTTAPEVNNIMFNPPDGKFEDVWPASAFSGLNSTWYTDWVYRLANSGITSGCRSDVINLPGTVPDITFNYYCPEDSVTRAQMAVFLERGVHGSSYTPPPAQGNVFSDIPVSYWAAKWIEQLSVDGITSGCGSQVYCPEGTVTRAQMAVFLLRAEHGTTYAPPAATGTKFTDIPADYWAAAWIEQLAKESITAGCGGGKYCPEDPVTRGQMAVFLVKTFNLP